MTDILGFVDGAMDALKTTAQNAVNRAGEITYDVGQQLKQGYNDIHSAIDTAMGIKHDPYANLPEYMRGEGFGTTYIRNTLKHFAPETLPKQMPTTIQGYRADPTGKFGGKDGLETQPIKWQRDGNLSLDSDGSPVELYTFTRSLAEAKKFGVPQLTPQELTALALKEGRTDFGTLSFDINNKQSQTLYNRLVDAGFDDQAAMFVTTVAEKKALAKRLNRPFTEVWNGTGKNVSGSTGAQYAKNYRDYYLDAAKNPKNKQLFDFIDNALKAAISK